MGICDTISVVLLVSAGISLSSSFSIFDQHDVTPNVCGGHCKGDANPCFGLVRDARESCEWANDHCCPPYGDGSQWTTTLRPDACGGYCISGKVSPMDCFVFAQKQDEYQRCLWALRVCCQPNGDGSQWTTTTTTSTTPEDEDKSSGLATWVIVVIAVGAILTVAILVGVGICFCVYFNGQKRNRRVNPGGGTTPAYGYPGTGAQPGLYQPVIQPQAQFTNESPFYA